MNILDGFLGSEYPENDLKKKRRELIKQGEYDDRYITLGIYKCNSEIP